MGGKYKKKYNRKNKKGGKWGKRFRTAKKWAGVAGSVAATAGTALSIASRVASLVNAEFKWVDNNSLILTSATPFDSSNPVVYDVTQSMAQGVGANQFIGQSVLMKSLYCRLRVVPSQNALGNPWTSVRFIVFIDNNLDGTAPVIGDIVQTTQFISPLSMDMPDRYTIISDKVYTASNANNYACNVKIFKKLSHHFKVSASSPTTDRAGRIFVALLTDSPNPYGPFVDAYFRLRFIDN